MSQVQVAIRIRPLKESEEEEAWQYDHQTLVQQDPITNSTIPPSYTFGVIADQPNLSFQTMFLTQKA